MIMIMIMIITIMMTIRMSIIFAEFVFVTITAVSTRIGRLINFSRCGGSESYRC